MPKILEYEPKDTIFHKMHITCKFTIAACSVILGTFWWDLRFLIPLFLLVLLFMYLAKVPLGWFKSFLVLVGLTIPPTISYVIFMTEAKLFKVLPLEFVSKPILTVKLFGFVIGLTYGNVYWLVANTLRIITVLIAVLTFIYSTSQSDLIEWLRSKRVPESVIFVIMTALRFFPLILDRAERIITAQKLRGWRVTSRNPAKLVKQIRPIAIPLTSFVVHMADIVTISVVTRGFGSTHGVVREWKRMREMNIFEKIVSIAYPIFTLIALYLLFAYNIGMI
ncbi:MAG TPA: energy-coupling factor transporter transmembrane protein EcfT [Nitrososphaeria archaeon]|nr:energy-coupling factor transporter transmembrane protein EcfT [Nitrososphaeria archaeon]